MTKRIIALISAVLMISAMIFSGCSKNESVPETEKEKIGIIGAMDVEVSTLKDAANITKTTEIAAMEFCEEHSARMML